MQTPQGDFVCLFHEAEDLAKAFRTLATSEEPFDVWFREHLASVHGLTAEMLRDRHLSRLPADGCSPRTDRAGAVCSLNDPCCELLGNAHPG